MIIFYKSQNKAKIYLNKRNKRAKKEKLIVFSNCDSLFEYIENQQDLTQKSKLFYCDNKFCLLFENKKHFYKTSNHIKAHLLEYGLLISRCPYAEIGMALKKIKGL